MRLEVEPKLRRRAELLTKTQRRISCYCTLVVHEPPTQLSGSKRFQPPRSHPQSGIWAGCKLRNVSSIVRSLAVALAVIDTAFSLPPRARRPRRPARGTDERTVLKRSTRTKWGACAAVVEQRCHICDSDRGAEVHP